MSKNYKDSAVKFVKIFFELADRVKTDPQAVYTNNRIPIDFDWDLVRTEAKYEIRKHHTNVKVKSVVADGQCPVGKLLDRYLELI